MKKLFKLILALAAITVLLVSFVSTSVSAETIASGNYGDNITWEYNSDNTLIIQGTGDMPTNSMPPWHRYLSAIEKVEISEGITSIAQQAFENSKITSIVIPDGVIQLRYQVFSGCEYLSEITLPYSLISVYTGAFGNIPSNVTIKGYEGSVIEQFLKENGYTFVSLGEVPKKVEITGAVSDTITFSVNNYGEVKFEGTGDMPGYNYNSTYPAPWWNFMGIGVHTVEIGEGITAVGNHNFYNSKYVEKIILPESLKTIGIEAFRNTGITQIDIPKNVTLVSEKAFFNCYNLRTVRIDGEITSIYRSTFNGCWSLEHIQLPYSVTEIYENAFAATSLGYIYYAGADSEWEARVSGKKNIPENVTVYYLQEIPDNISFDVTSVSKSSDGVEVSLNATLKGGESLFVAAYAADGTFLGAKKIHKSGSYYYNFIGNVKTLKIFVWDKTYLFTPVSGSELYVHTF